MDESSVDPDQLIRRQLSWIYTVYTGGFRRFNHFHSGYLKTGTLANTGDFLLK